MTEGIGMREAVLGVLLLAAGSLGGYYFGIDQAIDQTEKRCRDACSDRRIRAEAGKRGTQRFFLDPCERECKDMVRGLGDQ